MECLSAVSKHKSWLYSLLILILMVCQTQVGCIEEERKALLEIKASLYDSYVAVDLPTWVDDGNTSGDCCHWERVKCNTTTRHVTHLSLSNMMRKAPRAGCERIWPLNVSLFLHFKELKSLNLSWDCLDNRIVRTELGRLSSLKKLEILDLSRNKITNEIFPSLGALTSLRVLNLGFNHLEGYFPALALENLEILDLSRNWFMEGFERVSMLKKLKILHLQGNNFNESLMTSLSALPSLKALNINLNNLHGPFPAQELAHLTNLEELDLSINWLNDTPSIQDCNMLSKLKRLESIDLSKNAFNKSIIPCLSALPSLKTLDLSYNDFNGTLPMEGFASFRHLEVLDLTGNKFSGSIPSTIQALSSLRVVSFASNMLNGSLNHGRLPDTKGQFGTFTKESYEGNPLLCGPPLEMKCTAASHVNDPSTNESNDKWYDIDMASFYGSSGSTCIVFLLGFGAVLYINPYWRRRWLDLVEECMYTCYYFLEDSVRKLRMFFCK